ncbi:unnamed protein product [Alopecurus aequalis]
MAEEVAPQLGKEAVACILTQAMFASKNVRAQRDRLVQLRRRLQSPGGDAAALQEEVAAGLHKVYSQGLAHSSHYLTSGLQITAEHGARASFSISAFSVIPDEQLYGVLLSQWHPPRPTTQAEAFARLESAFYAVTLAKEHHLPRCVEILGGVKPPSARRRSMVGYSDEIVTAANDHLRKRFEAGDPDSDSEDSDAAPDAAAAAKPPQAASGVDLDQALSYLHRACSLTSLAVKNIDIVVDYISSFLDPEEVADTFEWADEHAYISEDGPYPSDNSD